MVIYDGEFLCVKLARTRDYKVVLELAKNDDKAHYLSVSNVYCLSPSLRTLQILQENKYNLDESCNDLFRANPEPKKQKLESKLYPFQEQGVARMLSSTRNILLADEMGLGKTVQVLSYLAQREDSFPAIVVCPATLKWNWHNEIKKWCPKVRKIEIISGRTPYKLPKSDIYIINYDILGVEDKEAKKAEETRKKKAKKNGQFYRKKELQVLGWCNEFAKVGLRHIIADEVQYIQGDGTIRSRAMKQLCETQQEARKIFMSGTPYETKTSQFFLCLTLLNKELFPNKYKYLMRYCDPKKTFFGWQYNGLTNGEELHRMISKFMIRRFKKDVLKDLPPKNRVVIPMQVEPEDLAEYKAYDEQFYQDVKDNKKSKKDQIGHLSKLRQQAFLAKKKQVVAWIKEYLLLTENKLVVFIYHKQVFEMLMEEFGNIAVGVNGGTNVDDRQMLVDIFQNDDKIKLFIGQIKACGAGITLTKAPATCFLEFGNTVAQHTQAEDRVHRISQEADSVMAYYLIVEGTIEEDAMSTLNQKDKLLKSVMDGEDGSEDMFDMGESMLDNYKKRKGLL